MIDIHSHILPGIDDGAMDEQASIAMAEQAVAEGIHTIIATPHHKNGQFENKKEFILQQVEKLNEILSIESIPLTVLPGQELRINGDVLADYEAGEILTLNGTQSLFIEFPSGHVPRYAERLLYDIQLKGLTPIIVHPERNQELITNPDLLYHFVEKGALTQVTAASVTGGFGKKIKKFSHQLIEVNLTHFIASDAHNITNRSFHMQRAYSEVEKEFGKSMVYLFMENAELLVEGKQVYKDMPRKIKTKKFLGLF
ncbi:tyrosine-protein phosphatase [Peribacillus asahii]|uniref:tyrosine-protein phosphatase n=1 Tax=Peribacillus asahii TaxID=228899 RepID=UPI00381C1C2A